MKLIELNPRWVGAGGEGVSDKNGDPVPERHGVGVSFDCPCGCPDRAFVAFDIALDGKPWMQGAPTWQRTGETLEDLSLTPSIQRVGGCAWHGFITNGGVTTC